MFRLLAVMSSLWMLVGTACASEPARAQESPVAIRGKPQAPVKISAKVGAASARVDVAFVAAAREVNIEVTGVDGLQITSPGRPVTGAAFEAGGVTSLDVAYRAPPGESTLAVFVTGTFGGVTSTKVSSFTIGTPTAGQRQKALQGVKTDGNGERVHVVPADRN